jgi:HAE1 family hydrophobic/amphiphilic exporter-1
MPSPPSIPQGQSGGRFDPVPDGQLAHAAAVGVNRYVEDLLWENSPQSTAWPRGEIFDRRQAVRIQVDPNALALRGIGIDEVANAIQRTSVNQPTGQLDGNTRGAVIHTEGQLSNAEEFASQIIAYRNNAPVRFADVANVIDGVENPRNLRRLGQQGSITRRSPSRSTVACQHGRRGRW